MTDQPLQFNLPAPADTDALGAALAPLLRPGMVVFLRGDLGVGKTSLARAILRALGYAGKVKSPTYTLVELYAISRLFLYHFDFYRFNKAREWTDAGFREYFNPHSICLVEWPEKAQGLLPVPDLIVALEHGANTSPATVPEAALNAGAETATQTAAEASNRLKNGIESGNADASEFESAPDAGRRVELIAGSEQGRTCLRELRQRYAPRTPQPPPPASR